MHSRFSLVPAAVIVAATAAPSVAMAQRRVVVNVDSVPQGASVHLDSETAPPIGTTPMRRTRIPAGAHTLYFVHDGFITGRLDVNVARRNESFTATLTQSGSIYVSADVDGAQVFLDGNPVGMTPGRINSVQPGQHIVEIRQSGMQTFRDTVTVGAGAVASVNATLRPPPPQAPPTGTVRVIVTNPNGALPSDLSVTFDGTPMTGAPPSVDNAQPGQHILQISANGFRTERREVTVTAGQATALAIDLAQNAPTGGLVRVIVPTQGAQVFLDGTAVNGSPANADNVPPGQHTLRIEAPGRQTVIREITVTAGQTTAVEIPDLTAVAQVGRINIHSTTPNATVFINGRPMGPSPYTRDDMPAGDYDITVRAQGFDDRTEHCSVSSGQACDMNMPLNVTVGRGAIHVELARPVAGAVVLIDGQPVGEVGAGRDIPNVSAQTHEIRVQAPRYQDYVQSVTLQDNQNLPIMVNMRRAHHGMTGAELAQRRAAISTWGASPLARGDYALDIMASYGSEPVEVRGTTGFAAYGLAGVDGGFAIRTLGYFTEIELRARAGLHLLDGILGLAAELNGFTGLGFTGQNNVGARGFIVASLHTVAPTSDEIADDDDAGQRENSNRLGSFAFSVRLGFEAMSDGLHGMLYHGSSETNPRFSACDTNPAWRPYMGTPPMGVNGAGQCNIVAQTPASGDNHDVTIASGAQPLVRMVAGVMLELGLSRHANLFAGVDRVLGSTDPTQARALYQAFWFGNDSFTYVHAGLTYKF